MSHFTVLLIGPKTDEEIDAALAPFQEYPDEDSPYYVFTDETDEVTKQYESKDEYKNEYKTVEEFAVDYWGLKVVDGKFGSYRGKNPKWDWWQVGGRWSGFFRAKENAHGEIGSRGVFGEAPREGYYDHIRKGDIDFDGMRKDEEKDANELYDNYLKAIRGKSLPPKEWHKFRLDFDNIDLARDAWNSYTGIPALRNIGIYDADGYRGGRAAFVARRVACVYSTYAVIYKGEWIGKGEMGWFGISHGDEDQGTWNSKINELLDSLDDDTMLTIIDCHI